MERFGEADGGTALAGDVRRSDVTCTLREVTPVVARMELAGRVSGTVNGVASEIEFKAKCRFDRKTNRIDWFAMLIGDKRRAARSTTAWMSSRGRRFRFPPKRYRPN